VSIKFLIAARQEWRCNNKHKGNCLSKSEFLTDRFDIDHVVPLVLGGVDTISNLQALCPGCHAQKTSNDMRALWDMKRELFTGKSKFFDPACSAYSGGSLVVKLSREEKQQIPEETQSMRNQPTQLTQPTQPTRSAGSFLKKRVSEPRSG
jgi:hypothetical protein